MGKIAILPDILASQVAAGEVVERPASVVKEMVENALDAGAKHVEVEISKGGTNLIKITDDGSGMGREDAMMCLERHATSKLKDSKQLMEITTMGFRGEAVPSIASVSKFRLATREHDAVEGTELIVDGGVLKDVRAVGLQPGSVFEVRSLFFNVPARRKFLKTENTESAHVEHQVRLHALAWPEVRFTYRKDGRVVFDLPGTGDRRMRIAGLSGAEAGRAVIEVPETEDAQMTVSGYVLPSDYARKGKRQQFIFLNGRPIEDPAISRAIKDAFKGSVGEGMHPACWLWITMDPSLVDVNVHPAKKEVRFHKPFEVRNLVLSAVEAGLEAKAQAAEKLRGVAKIVSRKDGAETPVRKPFEQTEAIADETKEELTGIPEDSDKAPKSPAIVKPTPAAVNKAPVTTAAPFKAQASEPKQEELLHTEQQDDGPKHNFQVLSVLHDRYFLMQGDDGLVLMDPKAARERIVYEAFLAGDESSQLEAQGLLVPELIELDARDLDVVMSNLENFTEAGISVEPFGGGTLQVRSMPALLNDKDPRSFITAVIDELIETVGGKRGKRMAYEVFAEKLAERVAWGEPCRLAGAERMLDELFDCELPYCTPDGRPTLIHISLKEIERKFGN
ncbi:DNA mismatch repair protein MutL [Rubritalea squalenifaciens DSM 18772]|uniref:DNA mismatch repair protein MutL n=1 Tax=Rubritalea squalenifaciens DSM 18772 TaxID=1123071 RepID=A0A1M6HE71_9BACT|nr:DNA mismatch repair endonuclease MutL [Rubritalea squalenifaciens]SHJ20485.1 DNA mismatch repair protein MutL [Rubritalea squalenifaciens DSM 18772]